jgi:hypothetical protein
VDRLRARVRAGTAARAAVVVAVLVVLVLPGRLLAAEHADDDALVPYHDGGGATAHAVAGTTWHTDAGVDSEVGDPLQILAVHPRVAQDTAAADVQVRICGPGGCRAVTDPPGGTVRLRPGRARLVVSVTPHRPGVVRIDGYDVTYLDGDHRGTEHAGVDLRLRAG